MATHFNYSLYNFSMNNAEVLPENNQPDFDLKGITFVLLFLLRIRNKTLRASRIGSSIRWINWNQKLKLTTKVFFVDVNENSTTLFIHFE